MRFVLDTSVSLSWFVDDPVPDLAVRARDALRSGSSALVPHLWHLEMANGLILAERRGKMTKSAVDLGLDRLEALLSTVIENDSGTILLRQAQSSARSFSLTAYDAVYLETALRENLPLATLDRALNRAAIEAGAQIFS